MGNPAPRLTDEQRADATRRVLAGEKAAALAREYGVTPAYISLLKAQALDPARFRKKREKKLTRKLTDEELASFREAIASSNPHELGLVPPTLRWCHDHGYQLAERMFGKRPSKRVVDECLGPLLKRKPDRFLRRPQPPPKHHVSQLDPELARDEDFVAYYLSPICEQITWREYERALADWEARYGDAEEIDLEAGAPSEDIDEIDWEVPAPMAAAESGRRSGKHAGSKGSPFTPPKKKRRKKRR